MPFGLDEDELDSPRDDSRSVELDPHMRLVSISAQPVVIVFPECYGMTVVKGRDFDRSGHGLQDLLVFPFERPSSV